MTQPLSPSTISTSPARPRRRFGLPLVAIIGLALLAVPRVVLHDLDILHEGTALNALFVFVPPIVWIIVALAARVPNPFTTIVVIGVCYGVFLTLAHQLFWQNQFADGPPQLGGNLAGLDPALQSGVLRTFAAFSSLVTGTVVGAIAGVLAWAVNLPLRRARQQP